MFDKQMREILTETLINGINESLDSDAPLDKQSVPTILAVFIMPMVLIDTIDRYIEHRIETDKVLIGILKDIHGELARSNDLNEGLSGGPLPKECM